MVILHMNILVPRRQYRKIELTFSLIQAATMSLCTCVLTTLSWSTNFRSVYRL